MAMTVTVRERALPSRKWHDALTPPQSVVADLRAKAPKLRGGAGRSAMREEPYDRFNKRKNRSNVG